MIQTKSRLECRAEHYKFEPRPSHWILSVPFTKLVRYLSLSFSSPDKPYKDGRNIIKNNNPLEIPWILNRDSAKEDGAWRRNALLETFVKRVPYQCDYSLWLLTVAYQQPPDALAAATVNSRRVYVVNTKESLRVTPSVPLTETILSTRSSRFHFRLPAKQHEPIRFENRTVLMLCYSIAKQVWVF